MLTLPIPKDKKVYFSSDFHLGYPNFKESLNRERHLLQWLNSIQGDAAAVFLMGDLFDFWFEYRKVVPKGFVRFLGKLANMSDEGIQIHIFPGNHDLWMWDYFTKEFQAKIHPEPMRLSLEWPDGKQELFIGHGDGLGPGDWGFKSLRKVFAHALPQWLFKWLHPDLGVALAHFWSSSGKSSLQKAQNFDSESDFLLSYVKSQHQEFKAQGSQVNAFVFGHRHWPLDFDLGDGTHYYNLGDWFLEDFQHARYLTVSAQTIEFNTYA